MASLSLKNICKVYPNGFEAVKDFNLEVEDKEFIIFVGPSGCGKSTFLRCLNRMNDLVEGCRVKGKVYLEFKAKYPTSSLEDLETILGNIKSLVNI